MTDWDAMAARINRAAMRPFVSSIPVVYHPQGYGGVTLTKAVWGTASVQMSDGDVDVVATRPTLGIDMQDLPIRPRMGDRLIRDNLEYQVTDVEEDGYSGAVLALVEVGFA